MFHKQQSWRQQGKYGEDKMKKAIFQSELNNTQDANIFVDENLDFFWVAPTGEYLWLTKGHHTDSFSNYIDEDHTPTEESRPEGVAPKGVIWNNADLSNPFDRESFEEAIQRMS